MPRDFARNWEICVPQADMPEALLLPSGGPNRRAYNVAGGG